MADVSVMNAKNGVWTKDWNIVTTKYVLGKKMDSIGGSGVDSFLYNKMH